MKCRFRSPNISCIQCLWERGFRKQRTWQEVHQLQRTWRKHRAASAHGDVCESAQYPRSRSRSVQRIEQKISWRFSWSIRRFRKLGNTWYRRTKWDETFMPRIYNALKCKMLAWRQRNNLWDRYFQEHSTTSTTRSAIRRRIKTSITMSIGKLDGGTAESHWETRRQRVHLQLRSGKPHDGKRVGAHGSPHHLRNGGDFGFQEGIPENRRGVDRTPTHKDTSVWYSFCSQARTAQN